MSKFEYSNAPESSAILNIQSRYQLFINGKFVTPKSGKYFNSINPATAKELAEFAYANNSDIDLAVKSARTALNKVWSKLPATERGKYLFRIARILQERAREFAVAETLDNG
ncbi:MAG: aldehyde dehydrogenase family protein, partial [Candidatus Fonsibacter sp.]